MAGIIKIMHIEDSAEVAVFIAIKMVSANVVLVIEIPISSDKQVYQNCALVQLIFKITSMVQVVVYQLVTKRDNL